MTTLREAVAKRISELLIKNKMTQYRLGLNSGVGHSTLSAIMRGRYDDIKFSLIIRIASGFDMTVSQFTDSPLFLEDALKFN